MSEYIGYVEVKGQRIYAGSFVLLKTNRGNGWNADGLMDRYINRIVRIKQLTDPNTFFIYQDPDDNKYTWLFSITDIESVCEITDYASVILPYSGPNTSIGICDSFKYIKEPFLSSNTRSTAVKFPKIIKFINRPEDRTLVVFFDDNTKTVAKCDPEDEFDLETGIEVCVMKKLFGNNYRSLIRKEIKSVALDMATAEKIKRKAAEEKERIRKKKEKYNRKKLEAQARREVELERLKKKYKEEE